VLPPPTTVPRPGPTPARLACHRQRPFDKGPHVTAGASAKLLSKVNHGLPTGHSPDLGADRSRDPVRRPPRPGNPPRRMRWLSGHRGSVRTPGPEPAPPLYTLRGVGRPRGGTGPGSATRPAGAGN